MKLDIKRLFGGGNSDNTAVLERETQDETVNSGAASASKQKSEDFIEDNKEFCVRFLESVLKAMNEICEVEADYAADGNTYSAVIFGGDTGKIIGRRGENLDALRYLTKVSLNRRNEGRESVRVELDIEGYARRQREAIELQVKKAVDKVLKSDASADLEPMCAYDRRHAHEAVNGYKNVKSMSVGNGNTRRVRIVKQ
ncbi:MAG: KH domain-containing protein [Clostridiales bacterium]|jgi:spoIIIJ-associated protein|nr:KH domain-containing protein [Clostridiales bacterium]